MATSPKRQSKSSNKSVEPRDQVVDVTPLNSDDQPSTPSKIGSSSSKKIAVDSPVKGKRSISGITL